MESETEVWKGSQCNKDFLGFVLTHQEMCRE